MGATCLFLAAKANDPKEMDFASLLHHIHEVLFIPPKEVLANEFATYAELEFQIFLGRTEVASHLERILDSLGIFFLQQIVSELMLLAIGFDDVYADTFYLSPVAT